MTNITYIPNEIANAAIDEHGNRKPVTRTHYIFDDAKGKSQAEVNADIDNVLALHQSEINALNSQNYVTVDSFSSLPATGAVDTVYRISNWDGTQQDPTVYSEYAWNGSQYVHLSTKTQIGEVFDISAYHATGGELAEYADLASALGTNGANVPADIRRGGMSVKFIQSSDHNYVQFRLMTQSFTTDVTQWQGVDKKPKIWSNNVVESNGVEQEFDNREADFVDYTYGKNLLDPSKIEEGFYFNSYGAKKASQSYAISPFIPIDSNGLVISQNGVANPTGGAAIVQYAEDKETVVGYTTSSAIAYLKPNAKYARFSIRNYLNGYNQIEKGTTATSYEDFSVAKAIKINDGAITSEKIANNAVTENKIFNGSITENKIADNSVSSEKIKAGAVINAKIADGAVNSRTIENGAVGIAKLGDTVIEIEPVTKNLLDMSLIEEGYRLNSSGAKISGEEWAISDFIPIDADGLVISQNGSANPTGGASIVQFADDKETIIGATTSNSIAYRMTGAKYARFSIRNYANGNNQIEKGTTPSAYVPYGQKTLIRENILPLTKNDVEEMVNPTPKPYKYINQGNLGNGDSLTIEGTELGMLYSIAFSGVIDTFNEITIGQTAGFYYPKLKITNTLIQLINNGDVIDTENSKEHGLTIANTIQILIKVSEYSNAKVILISNGSKFEMDITDNMWLDGNGNISAVSNGSILTSCSLSFNAEGFKKDIWMFGDSYFGNRTTNREVYWLSEFGYAKNALISGYAGEGSNYGLAALRKYIAAVDEKPKCIVWCLGMNNPDSESQFSATAPNSIWMTVISMLLALCEQYHITPVLATIPSATGTGGTVKYNGKKNEWVRNSGYRYIDLAQAVGASDEDGTWFSGMLSFDGIHPTESGAKTLALAILSGVPELMA